MTSMEKIKVSFIVPVYNMEKYLRECIDSIISQMVSCYEILLIDDGSTDHSAAICKEYVSKYSEVKYIGKENGGISSARNVGIEAAQGEYLCFVDSDDFFKECFASSFLMLCEQNKLDIIRGWYGVFDMEIKSFLEHPFPQVTYINTPISGADYLTRSVNEHANEVVPWLGFFRREYIIRHGLRFPEGIAYEEDQLFFLQALTCDPDCRVMQVDTEFYAYRKRPGSATKTPTLKQAEDVLFVVQNETETVEKNRSLSKEAKVAAKRYICSSFYQLTSIYGRIPKDEQKMLAKMTPFWMKWMCIRYPYDRHQQVKIILFTFVRWIVDCIYSGRK